MPEGEELERIRKVLLVETPRSPLSIFIEQHRTSVRWGLVIGLLGFAGWLFQDFLQTRVVTGMVTSRIFLGLLTTVMILVVWIIATFLPRLQKTFAIAASLILVASAFVFDYLTLPHPSSPSTQAPAVNTGAMENQLSQIRSNLNILLGRSTVVPPATTLVPYTANLGAVFFLGHDRTLSDFLVFQHRPDRVADAVSALVYIRIENNQNFPANIHNYSLEVRNKNQWTKVAHLSLVTGSLCSLTPNPSSSCQGHATHETQWRQGVYNLFGAVKSHIATFVQVQPLESQLNSQIPPHTIVGGWEALGLDADTFSSVRITLDDDAGHHVLVMPLAKPKSPNDIEIGEASFGDTGQCIDLSGFHDSKGELLNWPN